MSLAPKIDEIRHYASEVKVDLICVRETWLKNHIHDNIIAVEGYNLLRRDRIDNEHGGICTSNINFTILEDLQDQHYEVLWSKLRPVRLPRGYSSIVLGVVYHPPRANDQDLLQYLHTCLSLIESRFFNCGILLVGDFNKLNISRLENNYNLKQIVNFPTRGPRTLDLVLTSLETFYEDRSYSAIPSRPI